MKLNAKQLEELKDARNYAQYCDLKAAFMYRIDDNSINLDEHYSDDLMQKLCNAVETCAAATCIWGARKRSNWVKRVLEDAKDARAAAATYSNAMEVRERVNLAHELYQHCNFLYSEVNYN